MHSFENLVQLCVIIKMSIKLDIIRMSVWKEQLLIRTNKKLKLKLHVLIHRAYKFMIKVFTYYKESY